MRLKEMTPALVEELKDKLRNLEGQEFINVFQNPNFPHLNTSISGSVENQSTPTWYTRIHDTLEHTAVEYSEEDIESENFLEVKLVLLPHSLDVYFYLPNHEDPTIIMNLASEVQDIKKGTFRFKSPIINEVQFNRDTINVKDVA